MKNKIKVGLFGGSFNPIHNDHLRGIKTILRSKIVDQVWIVPIYKHAFDKNVASFENRVKMIKLAIRDIKNAKVSTIEKTFNGKNYTYNTLRKLKKKYKHEFIFVIGSDILDDFCKWKNYKYLLKNMKFIIVKRKGYKLKKIKGMQIEKIFNLNSQISATQIRNLIKKHARGKEITKLTPKSVYSYIKSRRLYNDL